MKNTLLGLALAATATSFATFAPGASAVIIDDFQFGGGSVTSTGPVTTPGSGPAQTFSGGLGGSRSASIIPQTSGAGVSVSIYSGGSGQYRQSNPAGISGASQLLWDANGAGLGGEDLTEGGIDDAIELDVVELVLDGETLELTVTVSSTGGFSQATLAHGALLTGAPILPYDSFVIGGGSGADFSNVDSIALSANAGDGVSFAIGQIGTTQDSGFATPSAPIPGTAALLGMGLLLVARNGRRRSQQLRA